MNQQRILTPSRRSGRGIALIEAMIGILIFAFGVLGLMGLQAAMTKAQTSSKLRADAANLAADLMGLIQSDNPANIPSYARGAGGSPCSGYKPCQDWLAKVGMALPGGDATVVMPGGGQVDVSITWKQGSEAKGKYETTMWWQP